MSWGMCALLSLSFPGFFDAHDTGLLRGSVLVGAVDIIGDLEQLDNS